MLISFQLPIHTDDLERKYGDTFHGDSSPYSSYPIRLSPSDESKKQQEQLKVRKCRR